MEVDGDQVYALHSHGELREINEYCMFDTLDTYFIFLRTRVMLVRLMPMKNKNCWRCATRG